MSVRILAGDCRAVLPTLPEASVQCVVTSPPYWGLRSYLPDGHEQKPQELGLEATPEEYVARMVEVFRQVRRVLRDDGTLWLNMGSGYVDKQETGMPWRLAFALQADGWFLRADIIWCLSGGAAVYARTQKGDMPMMVKDLVRLRPETVQLWNGTRWTQALGWSRSTDDGEGALELELRSGERIGCTAGHKWPTGRGILRADELLIGDVIESTPLPEPDAPRTADAFGLDVAWLCGLYLADGSMSDDKVQFAGHTEETPDRLDRLERVAKAFHGSAAVYTDGANSTSIVLYGPVIAAVVRAYVYGDNAHTKGLQPRAWARDNAWLRAFLDGYLAGDGHYDAKNDRWKLGFTRNDRLADDFRTLAARLDISLRLIATTGKGFGREWPIYRGDLRLNRTTHHNARVDTEIVAIRTSRARQFWDISESRRTDLAPATNPPCTPCAETPDDTPRRAVRPVASDSADHSDGSNSAADDCDGHPSAGTVDRSGDSRACRCEYYRTITENTSHFATFPPALASRCIQAGTSEKGACGACGAPWGRIVDRETAATPVVATTAKGLARANGTAPYRPNHRETGGVGGNVVACQRGWQPSCAHDAPVVPCTVLDCFGGSGTVGAVAEQLGRHSILIELSPAYVQMAEERTAQRGLFTYTPQAIAG